MAIIMAEKNMVGIYTARISRIYIIVLINRKRTSNDFVAHASS